MSKFALALYFKMNVFTNVFYGSIVLTCTRVGVHTYVAVIVSEATILWAYFILYNYLIFVITK